jgi:UDP-N-acetylmuramoylalanine--D-glutamate ligase
VIVYRGSEHAAAEPIVKVADIPLKGEHNVENVLAAVCAGRLAGLPADAIAAAVRNFRAVEHRLEHVVTIAGVEFYNDSKATNVDAALKAIASFGEAGKPVIHLILGGKDKDSDYTQMNAAIAERVKAVYTIGSAAEKIEQQLSIGGKLVACRTLETAVSNAADAAVGGDVVLLAPACSSFDQFENFEHRGRVFKALVQARLKQGEWQNV